jgi:hypothetical protein
MITFDEYLQKLNELAETHPEVRTFNLIYSVDDEGNAFHRVVWLPSMGKVDEYNDFRSMSELADNEVPNALCVN